MIMPEYYDRERASPGERELLDLFFDHVEVEVTSWENWQVKNWLWPNRRKKRRLRNKFFRRYGIPFHITTHTRRVFLPAGLDRLRHDSEVQLRFSGKTCRVERLIDLPRVKINPDVLFIDEPGLKVERVSYEFPRVALEFVMKKYDLDVIRGSADIYIQTEQEIKDLFLRQSAHIVLSKTRIRRS